MNNETIKIELKKADIISRLYKIQNIAVLIADCPDEKASICVLQGASESIVKLIDCLIDELEV